MRIRISLQGIKHFEGKTRAKSHNWDDLFFFKVRLLTQNTGPRRETVRQRAIKKELQFYAGFNESQIKFEGNSLLIFFRGPINL